MEYMPPETNLKEIIYGVGLPATEVVRHAKSLGEIIDQQKMEVIKKKTKFFVFKEEVRELVSMRHRDIKPENLYIKDGELRIGDFGLADKAVNVTKDIAEGTPLYMPPEAIYGKSISTHGDIYMATEVLYEMITGEPPFDMDDLDIKDNKDFKEFSTRKTAKDGVSAQKEVILLKNLGMNPLATGKKELAIINFFNKGMAIDPNKRFQSGEEMSEAFKAAFSQ